MKLKGKRRVQRTTCCRLLNSPCSATCKKGAVGIVRCRSAALGHYLIVSQCTVPSPGQRSIDAEVLINMPASLLRQHGSSPASPNLAPLTECAMIMVSQLGRKSSSKYRSMNSSEVASGQIVLLLYSVLPFYQSGVQAAPAHNRSAIRHQWAVTMQCCANPNLVLTGRTRRHAVYLRVPGISLSIITW